MALTIHAGGTVASWLDDPRAMATAVVHLEALAARRGR